MVRSSQFGTLVLTLFLLVGCQGGEPAAEAPAAEPVAEAPTADDGVVRVTVRDYSFTGPPSVDSGWNTFRLTNEGEEPHFMLLWKLPEGITFGDYAEAVPPLFGRHHARYVAGEIDQEGLMAAIGGELPEWFAGVHGAGVVGLVSPGHTAESTVWLEPGEYAMECYVKSADGKFHGEQGMLRPFIVNEEATALEEPEADVAVTLSNYAIEVAGELTSGEHTFAVTANDVAEGLLGHDLHLVRLAPEMSIDELVTWMNWVDQMNSPAPAEFLGGVDEVRPGPPHYFTATLDPGRYALISEGYAAQGIVHEFSVE